MWTNRFQIVHFSTVHPPDDTRIFSKECISLAKAGFSVTLVAPGDGSTNFVHGVTCRTVKIPRSRALRMTVGQLRMMAALFPLRGDLFHFHDPELMPAALALRLMGRRVVFDSHEHIAKDLGEKPWLSGVGRRVAGLCGRALEWVAAYSMSGIVITTPGMQRAYARGRTVLVRNLPKLEEFREPPAWEQRRPMVCYVGLVGELRGSRQIARLATRTSARIVVAGRLPDDERRKLQQEPGWRLVEYRGVLDRSQIVSLLSEAQLGLAILLPMRNFDDSIPTKMLEYLAAGIPVIASDFESWRALTEGVDCVTFVDPLDEEALARSVNALLGNPARTQVMGRLGRELVLKRFVWEREFEALLSFYSSLLCPTRPRPRSAEQCTQT
jgi:glycosyltransferase involved in cell wall biosynthesis